MTRVATLVVASNYFVVVDDSTNCFAVDTSSYVNIRKEKEDESDSAEKTKSKKGGRWYFITAFYSRIGVNP